MPYAALLKTRSTQYNCPVSEGIFILETLNEGKKLMVFQDQNFKMRVTDEELENLPVYSHSFERRQFEMGFFAPFTIFSFVPIPQNPTSGYKAFEKVLGLNWKKIFLRLMSEKTVFKKKCDVTDESDLGDDLDEEFRLTDSGSKS